MTKQLHEFDLLIVPGYTDSGPQHWQTLWQQGPVPTRRVQQRDWNRPERQEWCDAVRHEIDRSRLPTVLVGHSLGCLAIADNLRERASEKVIAAFLVAPCDSEAPDFPKEISGFSRLPLHTLAVPSLVVASTDDPWASIERSQMLAKAWGSELSNVGPRGHVNTASNLGHWQEGWDILRRFIGKLGYEVPAFHSLR